MTLSDIITNLKRIFQKKIKNKIQLENDSNLESNLKFLKVDKKSTPIQISEDTVNIQGSLNVNGSAVQTGTDAGATELDGLSDVTYSSGDLTITSLDKIISGSLEFDSSGNITLDAAGGAIVVHSADIKIPAEKKLYLDGNALSPETYIVEHSADLVRIVVGGDTMMKFTEASTETIAMSAEKVQITGTASYQPNVIIENDLTSTNSENPAVLTFAKTGEAAADGDNIGRITFQAIQEGGSAGYANSETFAYIQGEVIDSVAGSEAGQIAWHIFSDGGDVTAMTLAGNASDSRCALTLGADGAGCDFKVFGETADSYMLYDQSADKLLIHSDNDGELFRIVCLDDGGSVGPSIGIKRNSASPANDDDIGSLTFLGQDSGGNEVVYGKISSSISSS